MQFNSYLLEEKEYPLLTLQKRAEQLRSEGVDVINLTIGDPRGCTFAPVGARAAEFLRESHISQYPKAAGEGSYLEAASRWAFREYGVALDPDLHVISCNGTKEAIFHFPLLFEWSQGQQIFIPELSYPVYEASAKILDVPVRLLPLSLESGFLPDLDAISDEEWASCGLLWLNSPHNPTTAIASKAYLAKVLELAEKFDFYVLSDECYNDIYDDQVPGSFLQFPDSDRWVVFRSLSKRSHMTGFRIGAVFSKNELLVRYTKKLRAPMGLGSPQFVQHAAALAWDDDVHVQQNREIYRMKRFMLREALEEKGFDIFGANAGFYFWMRHPKLSTSESICDYLMENGLMVTPGTVFGPAGEGFVRMVYCESLEVCVTTRDRILGLREL